MTAGPARPAATPEITNMPAPTIAPIARAVASKRLRVLFSSGISFHLTFLVLSQF
jgi:hypothetical protein